MKKILVIMLFCLMAQTAEARYVLINSNDDKDIANMLTIATNAGCELKGTMFAQGNRFYHMTDCESHFDYENFKKVFKRHREDLRTGKKQLPRDIGFFIVELRKLDNQ